MIKHESFVELFRYSPSIKAATGLELLLDTQETKKLLIYPRGETKTSKSNQVFITIFFNPLKRIIDIIYNFKVNNDTYRSCGGFTHNVEFFAIYMRSPPIIQNSKHFLTALLLYSFFEKSKQSWCETIWIDRGTITIEPFIIPTLVDPFRNSPLKEFEANSVDLS